MELKLHKPVEIDGKIVETLEYDFDTITGKSIEGICKALAKTGNIILAQETDPVFHAHIFAEAASIAYVDIGRFHAKDFVNETTLVRDFFYMSSEESQGEKSSET
jgi:hypothetical protein